MSNVGEEDAAECLWLLEDEEEDDVDDDDALEKEYEIPSKKTLQTFPLREPRKASSSVKRKLTTPRSGPRLKGNYLMERKSKKNSEHIGDTVMSSSEQTVGVGRYGYNVTTLHHANYDIKRYFRANEEITYQIRIDLLKDYYRDHGHCNVPFRYTSYAVDYGLDGEKKDTYAIALGRWLHNLRKRYQANPEKIPTRFRQEFDRLGINWDGVGAGKRPGAFRNRCNQLKQFTLKHGHDRVPLVGDTRALGVWVDRQRSLYRKLLEGGDCGDQMSKERIEMLRESGLDLESLQDESMNGKFSARQEAFDNEWHRLLSMLRTFQDENGKFDVSYDPQSSNFGALLYFITEQRYQYDVVRNAYFSGMNKVKSTLTPERLQALVDMNFDFASDLPLPSPWKDIANEKFDVDLNMKLLTEHSERTGCCEVTLMDVYKSENIHDMLNLFRFQQRLRWEYRHESSRSQVKLPWLLDSVDVDIAQKLDSLGFCWDCVVQTTPNTADIEYEFEWWEMYHDLMRYREINGDFLLEQNHVWYSPELDDWFQEQKVKFSNLSNINSSFGDDDKTNDIMTEWHYQVLKSVGFGSSSENNVLPPSAGRKPAVLDLEPNLLGDVDDLPSDLQELMIHGKRVDKAEQLAWLIRFASIRRYYSQDGPGNLSNLSTDDISGQRLLMWANHQRKQYANFIQGKKSTMTKRRIDMLDSIGFDWKLQLPGGEGEWEDMKTELKKFREQYGHCFVPAAFPPNKKLGQWVLLQRQLYQQSKNIKKYNVALPAVFSKEKEQELMDIGLDLSMDNLSFCNMAYEVMWMCRLEELASFKEIHGHCNVPLDYASPHYELGVWTREQRILYMRYKEGAHSQLNKSRADDLEQIGFSWDLETTFD